MMIAVSLDVGANVRFLVMLLNAGGDGVRLNGELLRISHGSQVRKMEERWMGTRVDVDILLWGISEIYIIFLTACRSLTANKFSNDIHPIHGRSGSTAPRI